MGKYRSKIEIVAEILRVAFDGVLKTHIMYKCNLSYTLLNRYLADVLKAGLLFYGRDGSCYFTTGKGKDFLKQFESFVERSKRLDREISEVNYERKLLEVMALGKGFKK